jgi:hypothetical protein
MDPIPEGKSLEDAQNANKCDDKVLLASEQLLVEEEVRRNTGTRAGPLCEFDLDNFLRHYVPCIVKMKLVLEAAQKKPTKYFFFRSDEQKKAESFWDTCVANVFNLYKEKAEANKIVFCSLELGRMEFHYTIALNVYDKFKNLSDQTDRLAVMNQYCSTS